MSRNPSPNKYFRILLCYVNDMSHALNCDLFIYTDDSCLGNDERKIEMNSIKNLNSLCDWFVQDINFGEDKPKAKDKCALSKYLRICLQLDNIGNIDKKYNKNVFATCEGKSQRMCVVPIIHPL